MLGKIRNEIFCAFQQLVALLPDGPAFGRIRCLFYKIFLKRGGKFGSMSGLKIFAPEKISIGEGVSMNLGIIIDASGGGEIQIGDHVLIGPYCVIRSANHVFAGLGAPIIEQGHAGGRISIEDDCWLGSHVVVKEGVVIGRGAVIAANSLVMKDIPPYSIAMGVPARICGSRRA